MASSKKTMQKDSGGYNIQGFAPTRVEEVTADAAWTPGTDDVAFAVPEDCTYKIGGEATSGTLIAGAIRVVVGNQTYTFDTTMNIEVM